MKHFCLLVAHVAHVARVGEVTAANKDLCLRVNTSSGRLLTAHGRPSNTCLHKLRDDCPRGISL